MFGSPAAADFSYLYRMNQFLLYFLITAGMVVLALAGLGIKLLLSRKASFPEIHIGHNKEMHKRGIRCAKNEKSLPGCTSCKLSDHHCPE